MKKLRIQRAPSAISSRELSGPRAQQHGDVQALEEGGADATQVARAMLGHDPRRAQFQKVPSFWLAREHFVHRQQHLMRLQFWSEVTQVLDSDWSPLLAERRARAPNRPRHALGRTDLLGGKRRVDGCVEFRWPSSSAARLPCGTTCRSKLQGRRVSPTQRPRSVRLGG